LPIGFYGFFNLKEIKVNVTQAAKYLRVHNKTITKLVKENKLRRLADGGINSEDLELLRLEWEERKKITSPVWIKHGQAC
jgi:excisionase family DNA binding protein